MTDEKTLNEWARELDLPSGYLHHAHKVAHTLDARLVPGVGYVATREAIVRMVETVRRRAYAAYGIGEDA